MRSLLLLWAVIVSSAVNIIAVEYQTDMENQNATDPEFDQPSKLLSRRKRFLVFPDGSSFQLVFCAQNHGYLQLGNIVWFGNTAALAWELPTDPQLFHLLKKDAKLYSNRRQDSKHIYYLDEDGKVLNRVPYRRPPIINPAFAKRSIDGVTPEKNEPLNKVSIKDMHVKTKQRNHFNDLDQARIDFHRENRKELYGRIEKVLEGLGWNGNECVLRLLCETGKTNHKQGSFLEEIVKATFTLPRGRGFDPRLKYDVAHGTPGDCGHMYPDCSLTIM